MPRLKPQYEVFLNSMIEHGDQTRAYKEAYPDVTDETARVQAYRLVQNRTIAAVLNQITIERQKALEKVRAQEIILAAKNGIKTRQERILNLQRQIEDIQDDLDKAIMVDYILVRGEPKKITKEMNAETKAYLRQTIKNIQSEISKIEGDYAPEKHQHEHLGIQIIYEISNNADEQPGNKADTD